MLPLGVAETGHSYGWSELCSDRCEVVESKSIEKSVRDRADVRGVRSINLGRIGARDREDVLAIVVLAEVEDPSVQAVEDVDEALGDGVVEVDGHRCVGAVLLLHDVVELLVGDVVEAQRRVVVARLAAKECDSSAGPLIGDTGEHQGVGAKASLDLCWGSGVACSW